MPWWGAVLIAGGLTTVGFIFDIATGRAELTNAFSVLYVVGCIAAVLAVRQTGVFTAVVQPPLILFVAVPSAYFLFHRSEIKGLKDILINCGYPLIERFLLMFTTAVIVLLIGMARWYFGTAPGSGAKAPASKKAAAAAAAGGAGLFAAAKAKLSTLTERDPAEADAAAAAAKPLKHGIDRPAPAPPPERVRRPAKRPAPTTSKHARPPVNDPLAAGDPAPPPQRRGGRRPSHAQDLDEIVRNLDAEPLPPRRRTKPREPGRRPPPPYTEQRREPRQPQRDPRDARDPYDRPQRRPDPYDRYPPGEDLYERPARSAGRPPAAAPGGPGANGTHHPVSRVRYRDGDGESGGARNGERAGERPAEQNPARRGEQGGAHERPRARPKRDDGPYDR